MSKWQKVNTTKLVGLEFYLSNIDCFLNNAQQRASVIECMLLYLFTYLNIFLLIGIIVLSNVFLFIQDI